MMTHWRHISWAIVVLIIGGCGPVDSSPDALRAVPAGKGDWSSFENRDHIQVGMIITGAIEGSGHLGDARALDTFVEVVQAYPALDVVLAHEWYLSDKRSYEDGLVRGPAAVERIKRRLQDATANRSVLAIPGTVTWVGSDGGYRNTALAFSSGTTIFEYSKRNDGGDVYDASHYGLQWEPGQEAGLFGWRSLDVGLEICADHAAGSLRGNTERQNDLHIVLSCGMYLIDSSVTANPHGYFLIDDCYGDNQRAFVRTGDTTMTELTETGRFVLDFDPTRTLVTFDLPVPGQPL